MAMKSLPGSTRWRRCFWGTPGRHGLPHHLIPLGGIRTNPKPSRAIRRQRREQKNIRSRKADAKPCASSRISGKNTQPASKDFCIMPAEGGNTMKETYIQQVKQELSLPKKKKEAIARDLREAFRLRLGTRRNRAAGHRAAGPLRSSRAAFRSSSVPTLCAGKNGAIAYPSPCPLSLASCCCCWESRRA